MRKLNLTIEIPKKKNNIIMNNDNNIDYNVNIKRKIDTPNCIKKFCRSPLKHKGISDYR